MREYPPLLSAAALGLVSFYGSMNGGHPVYTVLFLAATYGALILVRTAPRHSPFIMGAGVPLTLTTGSYPFLIVLIAALLLGLTLLAGDALRTRAEYLLYGGSFMLSVPFVLLFLFVPGTLFLLCIMLSGIAGFTAIFILMRLRFQIRVRGEAG
jgi:hypothetical protein